MQSEALRSHGHGPGAGASMHPLLDGSNVVVVLAVTMTGRVLAANRAFARSLGMDSAAAVVGKNASTDLLVNAADWIKWQRAETTGAVENVELAFRRVGNGEVILRGDIHVETKFADQERALIGVFVDVSNVKNLETALQRSARMEALSALVTGAAHDLNNILTVLIGNLYLVAEGLRQNPALFGKVKAARDVARRGAELIKQLLTFARAGPTQNGRVDVASLIAKLEPLLSKAVGSAIKLSVQVAAGVTPVDGNSALLESAIVNLVVNAKDALGGRGQIAIRVAGVSMDAADAGQRGIEAGRYVKISVIDDGPGIPEEIKARIFEPFFTTKKDSGGTGLGLSMVRRMAEQTRGAVEVASKPGKGTSISIVLPCSDVTTAETAIKTMPLSTLPTGKESVLLIADDEEILTTINQILDVLGYKVRSTSRLGDIPQLIRANAADLIIIDSTAGSVATGSTEPLTRIAPRARLLFIDDAAGASRGGVKRNLLIKPFALADLASAVRKTLDGDCRE